MFGLRVHTKDFMKKAIIDEASIRAVRISKEITQEQVGTCGFMRVYNTKFAEIIIQDIITVVGAHTLNSDSAIDVFVNLKHIYEGNTPY